VTQPERVVTSMEVDGRRMRITNPDRLLWPATGTRKRDLIDYYLAVAPGLLPHIAGRGLTLGRWPEGVDATGWLQAECRGRPDWMPALRTTTRAGGTFEYCVVEDRPGLVWLANLGTIELHPFLGTAARPNEPSCLVFDLDPGAPASIVDCCRVAMDLRDILAADGLEAYPKTSGVLGLHCFVPLAPGHTFGSTKGYARAVAGVLAERRPDVTDRMARDERAGKVYVDWVQNDASRSTVAVYSPRAAPAPWVSTPVTWEEVAATARDGDRRRLRFGFRDVLDRLDRFGDLFAPVLDADAATELPTDRRRSA
jgi:bifunctional non-homologous end joining protein LigD